MVFELRDLRDTVIFFLLPTAMVISGLLIFEYPLDEHTKNLLSVPLFGGLALLLAGFIIDVKMSRYLRSLGWIIFAFYWSTQINTLYYYEGGDVVNAVLCGVGVYLLIYFSYKELTSDADCLPWLAGVAGIAGTIYFSMESISVLKTSLINMVARHTAMLYSVFDSNIRAEGCLIWAGYDFIKKTAPTAEIIFACTAIQSMLLFVGLILPLREVSVKKRLVAIGLLIPTIYFLNLIRNAMVVYLVGYNITDMNIAHNYVGKSGSLLALIILVFLVFKYIPELYEKVVCTVNLYKNEGPIERTLKKVIK
ncbi:MAG: archaeosortase A [Thermoplasmata archaeon]|nr:MAG: archaeosortase A [Thermoplasmata archaeon]